MKADPIRLYQVAAVRDAAGVAARPGAVAVQAGRILAAGAPDELPRRIRERAEVVHRPTDLFLPALVNAHAHLDLTDLGPTPFVGDFIAWLRDVIDRRPTQPEAIAAAVRRGLALSREAGVGYVGDIAGSVAAIAARHRASTGLALPGVSYLECFGHGQSEGEAVAYMERTLGELPFEQPVPGHDRGVVLGLAPHAPYSTGRSVYEAANHLSHKRIYRLSTHLAESLEELAFVEHATGPFVDLLRRLGKWDDTIQPTGQHPVAWLEPVLRRGRWLLAHCNYVNDEHIAILRRTGTSVAYCPRASAYFGHPKDGSFGGGHRYREMLAAGVNVCLGTDSILCQPPSNVEPQPMGILPQMRYLYRRDAADADLLLRMATTNGMRALDFIDTDATLREGAPAVFTAVTIDPDSAVDPLVQAMENDHPARRSGMESEDGFGSP